MVTLATYQSYREVGKELMTKVMQSSLSREALDRAAKALGIVEQDAFRLESEEEMAVLFVFALHDVRIEGRPPSRSIGTPLGRQARSKRSF